MTRGMKGEGEKEGGRERGREREGEREGGREGDTPVIQFDAVHGGIIKVKSLQL